MSQQAQRPVFERFDASAYTVGIVAAQFNRDITDGILDSALTKLAEYEVGEENIKTLRVAGSIEVPLILETLARSGRFDCLLAIGGIIRGESAHFDYVCQFITDGVLRAQLQTGVPIGFGVLTTLNHQQAEKRLRVGAEAAEAALQSAKLIKELEDE